MGHGVRADDIRTPSGYDKVQNSTSGGREEGRIHVSPAWSSYNLGRSAWQINVLRFEGNRDCNNGLKWS